ncbi:deleted in lung and esophageal cancer protein 1 isoform B [Alligator mississippiensis]|uniref:Deleted in lung and esophageal cancer protein 1 isoform B n=1 Tax=Alligator mississippiensis TaxID=8496 RepID=A0A151PD31_ALLMI|nr:deleted in lung and esophageal cancer protein 1 isoform B [Alligator mississippiensis]
MRRHRPGSQRTQDISHLLTSVFSEAYTAEPIGAQAGASLVRSRGGDDPHHERFVAELQQLRAEYNCRLAEADMVEKHIIQARAQATAEEERTLNMLKADAGEDFQYLDLPPVKSSFRWFVDDELLKKHHLICPGDYIADRTPITRAPKGKSEPDYIKETFSFKQLTSRNPRDKKDKEIPHLRKTPGSLPEVSLSTLTLSSTPETNHQTKKSSSKKSGSSKKSAWKNTMCKADREQERAYLARLENRHNYLKNPRFFPPNTSHGGRSLIFPQKKIERMLAGRRVICDESDPQAVPVFLANPPTVLFSNYEVGKVYEMTIELQNTTAVSRHVRVIPPSTPAFAIGLGKFPGEGGIVAPGMTCQYTIQFIPEYLADYEDYILVETQASYPLLIPIEARRPPPILTLPRTIDCGSCLVGGVKITDFACRNEGLSTGKFCIMPKSAWPSPTFRAVATIGFVEQAPFGIHPPTFELWPGEATLLEVAFFPSSPGNMEQVYTIVCDNCQVNDITVTGLGQLIALELLSVTGGECFHVPGEARDITAQHLVCFDSQNPHSTTEKQLIIRNSTHVELPFYWQIIKPNLQSLMPEEPVNSAKIKYNLDTESGFSLNPAVGVLQPHTDHKFTLTYAPKELKDYHSVIQIVLRDIPEPPSSEKQVMILGNTRPRRDDVIALEIEVKGSTEPFQLLLEPYAIFIPGENFIGINIRKSFKMWNNSKSSVKYSWGKISECDILEVEPHTGFIEANECCEFELNFTGGKPGHASHNLHCKIEHSTEPVVLHAEAAFKGPVLSVGVPSLQLGLIKLGENVLSSFEIQNLSPLPAQWRMQESRACLAERNEEVSQFTVRPSDGELPPLGECRVSVLFEAQQCQHLQTVLELVVENGKESHLPVFAEVQTPQACLISSHLVFSEIYIGVPAQANIRLFNQILLPAKYCWGELIGSQSALCSAIVTPASGILGPNEEKELCVELTANTLGELKDLILCCSIEDMKDPLFLAISGQVKGLHVTYSIPYDSEVISDEKQMLQRSQDLLLDFGSEVPFQGIVKRQLMITNHTGIEAPFIVEADYFQSCLPKPEEQGSSLSTTCLVKRTAQITRHVAKRAQSALVAALLSHGRGAAFHAQPSTGTMKAFQRLVIEITAYNNMWGEYHDDLICVVGDLKPTLIPMQMTVKGCPIFLQMTGPQAKTPIIRFGTHISGGDTVSRCIRLNNPTPFDIRVDWETYNQEPDSEKLVDLLVFYGTPFPLKDIDGNEVESSISTSETEGVFNYSTVRDTTDTISPTSQLTDASYVEDGGGSDSEDWNQATAPKKIISVIIQAHEGVPSDHPFCVTPRQIVIPGGGSTSIHVAFIPLILPQIINKMECQGYALGFMSLDQKLAQMIPGKVSRSHGREVAPLRIDLQALVKPALLNVEMDCDEGLVFHSVASDLIQDQPLSKVRTYTSQCSAVSNYCSALKVLTASVTSHNLKLTNSTGASLHFRLLLSMPFSVAGDKSLKTAHGDREEQEQELLLHPQQNVLVKVSFHMTLELLTYQSLPAEQLLPGIRKLELENGDRKLEFSQHLVIEYKNRTTQQLLPVTAFLTVPVLELSCETVDFATCFVGQPKIENVFLLNRSRCRSYWIVLLDQQEQHTDLEVFSISPSNGSLEAREADLPTKVPLQICFTARSGIKYETTATIVGLLGEKSCALHIRGRGSYDEKYEDLRSVFK